LADLPVATIDAQIDASSCRQEQRSTCDLVRLPHASKRASARARLAVVWGAFGPACQREEPSIVTSESGRDTRALKSDHQNLVPGPDLPLPALGASIDDDYFEQRGAGLWVIKGICVRPLSFSSLKPATSKSAEAAVAVMCRGRPGTIPERRRPRTVPALSSSGQYSSADKGPTSGGRFKSANG
jgi:hypothetical protein